MNLNMMKTVWVICAKKIESKADVFRLGDFAHWKREFVNSYEWGKMSPKIVIMLQP